MSAFSEASPQEVLLLSGSIEDVRSNQRKLDFDSIIKHTGEADVSNDYGNNRYVIQTLDSADAVLTQYFFSDYEYEGKYYAKFIANLPADNVKAIEIGRQSGGIITEVFQRYEHSANAPVVNFTGPSVASLSGDFMITWNASDVDGDDLLSELQVSSDSGNTWDTIAVDIPYNVSGEYSHILNSANFPKGENYKFKVVVTDGMYSVEAVSDKEYTVEGYETKPILYLPDTEATVKIKSGTQAATIYFTVGNSGKEELELVFTPDNEASTFVSPLFIKEYTIYPDQNQLIAIPLIFTDDPEGPLEETIRLQTNEPGDPITTLTIKVTFIEDGEEDIAPELVSLQTTPSDFSGGVSGSELQVTFEAYAVAGQTGLEATIMIEDKDGNQILNEDEEAQSGKMVENYHKPGAYLYYWENESLPAGNYGVNIGLKDTQSGLERVRTEGEYDLTFNIKEPNSPPVCRARDL